MSPSKEPRSDDLNFARQRKICLACRSESVIQVTSSESREEILALIPCLKLQKKSYFSSECCDSMHVNVFLSLSLSGIGSFEYSQSPGGGRSAGTGHQHG